MYAYINGRVMRADISCSGSWPLRKCSVKRLMRKLLELRARKQDRVLEVYRRTICPERTQPPEVFPI